MTSQNNFSPIGFDPTLVQAQAGANPGDLQTQIDSLRARLDDLIKNHFHDGNGGQRIRLNTDIAGLFETVSMAPTAIPQTVYDQIKVYANGLYIYDTTSRNWRYASLT